MRRSVIALMSPRHYLWLAVLLALLIGGIAFVPAATAQGGTGGSDSPQLTVLAEAVNVRSGPGVAYPTVGVLTQGQQAALIGHHAASGWWQIQLPGSGAGWVTGGAAYVMVGGNATAVPEVTALVPAGAGAPVPASAGAPVPATAGAPAKALAPSPAVAGKGGTIVFQTATGGDIYAVAPNGTNLRRLTNGLDPALSPDGQWVAFARWNNDQNGALGSLWVIKVDGSGERVVLGDIHQPKSPVWSPDGKQIAISQQHGGRVNEERKCSSQRPPPEAYDISTDRDKDGDITFCFTLPPHPHYGLRVVNVDSGTFQDLPNDLFSLSPTWDPVNATHLVYDGEEGLMNLDISGGTMSPLTADIKDHSPAFSPDGNRIAVTYWQANHWEIEALSADGSGRAQLTQTSIRAILEQQVKGQIPKYWNNASAAWSPDGSQIAFVTDRTGQWEVWVMNADGTNPHPLLPSDIQAGLKLQYNGMEERMVAWR
jgi:dipeptidyl aminopeptidase/acylaminoacyl peptidase